MISLVIPDYDPFSLVIPAQAGIQRASGRIVVRNDSRGSFYGFHAA